MNELLNKIRASVHAEEFNKLWMGQTGDVEGDQNTLIARMVEIAVEFAATDKEVVELVRSSALYYFGWDDPKYQDEVIKTARSKVGGEASDFIYASEDGKKHLDANKLATYIREKYNLLLVKNHAFEDTLVYAYRHGVYELVDSDAIKAIVKSEIEKKDRKLVSTTHLREVEGLIKCSLDTIGIASLDSDEKCVNLINGLLKMDEKGSWSLVPHSPDVLSSIQLPIKWDPNNTGTPVFDQYMDMLTMKDEQKKNLILEIIGLAISNVPAYKYKKAFFFVGAGNTGKSQIRGLIEYLLGEKNCIAIDLDTLEARFGIAYLLGKRMAGAGDMTFIRITELNRFKSITGGDSLMAELKGKQGFSFKYSGILLFCANHLPEFGGDTGQWVYDRILPIVCSNVVPAEQRDPNLLEKLKKEAPGIVFKALNAFGRTVIRGYSLSETAEVIEKRQEYKDTNNSTRAFWHECMVDRYSDEASKYNIGVYRIYKIYTSWARTNSMKPASFTEFRRDISEICKDKYENLVKKVHGVMIFKDVSVKKEIADLYEF